jgi:hypothetical protein
MISEMVKTAGVHLNCGMTKHMKDNYLTHNWDSPRGSSGGPIFAYWMGQPQIFALNVDEFRNGGDKSLQLS